MACTAEVAGGTVVGHDLGGCVCRQSRKEERLQQLRNEQAQQQDEQLTLTPRINPASRHMALHLARRVAQQDPRLLAVIQSQPQGWVLGPHPATPRRYPLASGISGL